jgi:hypothetical protein
VADEIVVLDVKGTDITLLFLYPLDNAPKVDANGNVLAPWKPSELPELPLGADLDAAQYDALNGGTMGFYIFEQTIPPGFSQAEILERVRARYASGLSEFQAAYDAQYRFYSQLGAKFNAT